jgi:hypothetical protein
MRITGVLAVRVNGEKVTTLVILKPKDGGIENKYVLWIDNQSNAWVNQCLLKIWLELVFPSVIDSSWEISGLGFMQGAYCERYQEL